MSLIKFIASDQSGINGAIVIDCSIGVVPSFVYERNVVEMILISGKRVMLDHRDKRRAELVAQWRDEGYRQDTRSIYVNAGETIFYRWIDGKYHWRRLQMFWGSDIARWKWYLTVEGEKQYRLLNGYDR